VLRHFGQFGLDFADVFELELRLLEPSSIRLVLGEIGLELFILDDPSLLKVNEQHFAGLKSPFARDILFAKWEHAALRCEANDIIFGDAEAGRTQSVAIERSANLSPIGEAYRCWAIPWFHQSSMVLVERAPIGIHQAVAGPGLWDQHHHRVRKAVPPRKQELQGVIEARCV